MQEDTLIFDAVSPEIPPEDNLHTITRIPWKLSRLKYFCREGRVLLFSGRWMACASVSLMLTLAILGGKRMIYLFGVLFGIPEHYALSVFSDLLMVILSAPILTGMYLTLGDVHRGNPFRPGDMFRLFASKTSLERCWCITALVAVPFILVQIVLHSGLWLAEFCLHRYNERQDWQLLAAALGILLLTAGFIWLFMLIGQRLRLTVRIAWDHPRMPLFQVIRCSVHMTHHFCREGLSLSFAPIGWFIAALLSCGILQALVLIPYTLALRAVYDIYLLELRDIPEYKQK